MDVGGSSALGSRYIQMSDRAIWLAEWCPTCRAAPGARCRSAFHRRTRPLTRLHVSRGWRARRCPTCHAHEGERCATPSGRDASAPHTARLRPSRTELLVTDAVFAELDRLGVVSAAASFDGRSGAGGHVGRVALTRLVDGSLVESELGWAHDELAFAVAAPVWDRFGSFAGQPRIEGRVRWDALGRLVLISGRRGHDRFEERL